MDGGSREPANFPLTTWGMVVSIQERRREGLETLCRRYWKPVYRAVRRTRRDAEDLTQAFFAWVLEGEAIARFAPERGSFRTYLRALLRRFLSDQDDLARAKKRGGDLRILPLDEAAAIPDEPGDPDEVFDRAFRQELLAGAIERTREAFSGNRAIRFRAFELYTAGGVTYAEVAGRLEIKEGDVRNHLFAVRERIRQEVRAQLSQTVAGARDLDEEYRVLFG